MVALTIKHQHVFTSHEKTSLKAWQSNFNSFMIRRTVSKIVQLK